MPHSKFLSQVFQVGFWCCKKQIWSTHQVDWEDNLKMEMTSKLNTTSKQRWPKKLRWPKKWKCKKIECLSNFLQVLKNLMYHPKLSAKWVWGFKNTFSLMFFSLYLLRISLYICHAVCKVDKYSPHFLFIITSLVPPQKQQLGSVF